MPPNNAAYLAVFGHVIIPLTGLPGCRFHTGIMEQPPVNRRLFARKRQFTAEASDQAGLASWVANIRAAADEMATHIADMLMRMGGD